MANPDRVVGWKGSVRDIRTVVARGPISQGARIDSVIMFP